MCLDEIIGWKGVDREEKEVWNQAMVYSVS